MALGKCHLEWPGSPRQLTTKCFHVLDSHPEHGELVQLAGHGVARGHQRGQLVNEAVHLIPAPLLDLAVSLPAHTHTQSRACQTHGAMPKATFSGWGSHPVILMERTADTLQIFETLFRYLLWIIWVKNSYKQRERLQHKLVVCQKTHPVLVRFIFSYIKIDCQHFHNPLWSLKGEWWRMQHYQKHFWLQFQQQWGD